MLPKLLLFAALTAVAAGQSSPQPGITVYPPGLSTDAIAVDLAGNVVHT